jgi:hypothetical protein
LERLIFISKGQKIYASFDDLISSNKQAYDGHGGEIERVHWLFPFERPCVYQFRHVRFA